MSEVNRQIILARYPSGTPVPADFALVHRPLPPSRAGCVLVRTLYLSMDPFPRLRMDPASKMGALPLGSVVIGRGVGRVVASTSDDFRQGDYVTGELGWQDFAWLDAASVRRVDRSVGPVRAALHVLGPSGLAAHIALFEEGRPAPGQTVVVAAAAGAVGAIAAQLARLHGCRVVGLCLGEVQADYLRNELLLDAAIDVQTPNWAAALAVACPRGADVFLDSVGGDVHNAVMAQMTTRGRVVVLGYISAYNAPAGCEPEYGRLYEVLRRRLQVSGFLLADHAARFPAALEALAAHYHSGRLRLREHVTQGLERAPEAFAALFDAAPPGKQLVQVADEG